MIKLPRFNRLLSWLFPLFVGLLLGASSIDPRVFWLATIFNPLLPWLLFFLLLLLLWQVYRRRYALALIPLAVLLLSWPKVQKTIAWASPLSIASTHRFSLATANVYSFKAPRQNNYPLDSQYIREFVDRLAVDVLLLQEYDYSATNWRSLFIQEQGGFLHLQKISKGALAVFSRWPLHVVEEKPLANKVNGYQVIDVKSPHGTFRLINLHLKSNQITHIADQLQTDKELPSKQKQRKILQMFSRYGKAAVVRTEQAAIIANIVNQSPHPVIVAGDLNEVPSAYPYRLLLQSQRLQDSWLQGARGIGTTFAGTLPGLRIDYILPDTTFLVQQTQVMPEGEGDHRPVKTILNFK